MAWRRLRARGDVLGRSVLLLCLFCIIMRASAHATRRDSSREVGMAPTVIDGLCESLSMMLRSCGALPTEPARVCCDQWHVRDGR